MSRSANVRSVQALKDFKVVMANYAEEARNSLGGVDMELRRMRDWLERDQLGYWQSQVKKRSEDLMQAKADLYRRQLSQQGSEAVSDADQKEALREAQKRLRVAEEKVALVKRLIPQLQHAIDEYHSHSQPLGDHLSGGFEKSMATLEKMIQSLESYLAVRGTLGPGVRDRAGVFRAGISRKLGDLGRGNDEPRGGWGTRRRRIQDRIHGLCRGRRGERGRTTGIFRENTMSAHSGRLHHALKHLREQWDIAQESWDDQVRAISSESTSRRWSN